MGEISVPSADWCGKTYPPPWFLVQSETTHFDFDILLDIDFLINNVELEKIIGLGY
jgi:hypothetical protein